VRWAAERLCEWISGTEQHHLRGTCASAGLFGGDGTGGLDLGDTWAYDGTNCAICRRAESYTMADSDLAFSGVPSDGAVDATSPLWSGGELQDPVAADEDTSTGSVTQTGTFVVT